MIAKDKACTVECNKAQCPFVNDPRNPRRYVCLKCGFERTLDSKPQNKGNDWTPLILIIISVAFIFLLML